jgi:hypothetical protein
MLECRLISFGSEKVPDYYYYYYYYYYNCYWVDTQWQQYSINLHTSNTQITEKGTYKTIMRKSIGKCGPCPVFASYTLAFSLQLGKKHGKPSVKVAEKYPDIEVAVVLNSRDLESIP